mgnify:CR=1 FL=1
MIHYVENDFLKIGVKQFGCELTSIVSKKSGAEYLWQGDASFWRGQSPVLFPIIGRLLEDKYYYNGREYAMAKHGFARLLEWTHVETTADSLKFLLTDNEETMKSYPFRFDLYVTFSIDKNRLTVSHDVINKNNFDMYFSIGAHPAFNCSIGDILTFEQEEDLDTFKIDLEKSLLLPDRYPVMKNSKDLVITKDIFNEDALIFSDVRSQNITLHSNNHNRSIKFNTGASPYLGIWAKPGAPYVCIEPWFGINDSPKRKQDLSEKTGIEKAAPDSCFNFTWYAEINE